jgi:NADH:ubiquinone oxidoreductase subunit D
MDTKDILAELIRIEAKIAKLMPQRRDDLTTVSIVFTGRDHEDIRALIANATQERDMEFYSDCCGVAGSGEMMDMGICPSCRDHCQFTACDEDGFTIETYTP